ncbi:tRNA uridine 5-carboxymethylaminomethyl modification enzyme MnmG [Candidatus Hepatincola sp. Pdp]
MEYDVIIVGAGHAGVEAATAAARKKATTLLITMAYHDIGAMSCNPAIGGLGKGHIVREIDALDGLMGKIIDKAGIQFRVLNASKGSAVQGPRAQADRKLYRKYSQEFLQEYTNKYNLQILEGNVVNLHAENNKITGIILANGKSIKAKCVVLTTGTFLNGVIHCGEKQYSAGRYGAKAAIGISDFLKQHNFAVCRFKTGTPARLDGNTINWDILTPQQGDATPQPFSFLTDKLDVAQIQCYITETNSVTHKIIADNLHKSAMYSGNISGKGPRYCPSIEDKIVRFAERNSHQVFLEPEGLDDATIYPNGLSTSLPEQVQLQFLRSMKGLEQVEVIRYGYAIEYDYVNPEELYATMETKKIQGLFFAGQINGTTGYEEAAGQGLVAGVNAALCALNPEKKVKEPFVLDRFESYIGVMIDDLTHKGVAEPYRMFTSRAEYRMMLRANNADQRLSTKGYNYGIVSESRYKIFQEKLKLINYYKEKMANYVVSPNNLLQYGITLNQDGIKRNALELLSISIISPADILRIWEDLQDIPENIMALINSDCKYFHYMKKQQEEIVRIKQHENINLPDSLKYEEIAGLSAELVETFNKFKPRTMGDINKIKGSTPSSALAIFLHLKKKQLI